MIKLTLIIFVFFIQSLNAQLLWNGIYTVDVKKGGENSSLYSNGLSNGKFSFYPGKLQLFLDAEIEKDKIYFNSKIEANTIRAPKISPISIYQISVSFLNIFDEDLNFEIGRILTPFGRFKEFQHSPDNPFLSFPLSHRYYTNASNVLGLINSSVSNWTTNNNDNGLQIVYHGTYFTGAKIFGSILEEKLKYDLSVTNSPISSFGSDIDFNNQPALTGRIVYDALYWLSIGTSFGYGNYLNESPANKIINVDNYNQISYGADLRINYLYYDLIFEFINNRWQAPVLNQNLSRSFEKAGGDVNLDVSSLFLSLKIDLPFWVGTYIAGKYEMLTFNDIFNPILGSNSNWTNDQKSFEIAAGYKLSSGTLLKISYQKNISDQSPEPNDDVIGTELSVVF